MSYKWSEITLINGRKYTGFSWLIQKYQQKHTKTTYIGASWVITPLDPPPRWFNSCPFYFLYSWRSPTTQPLSSGHVFTIPIRSQTRRLARPPPCLSPPRAQRSTQWRHRGWWTLSSRYDSSSRTATCAKRCGQSRGRWADPPSPETKPKTWDPGGFAFCWKKTQKKVLMFVVGWWGRLVVGWWSWKTHARFTDSIPSWLVAVRFSWLNMTWDGSWMDGTWWMVSFCGGCKELGWWRWCLTAEVISALVLNDGWTWSTLHLTDW